MKYLITFLAVLVTQLAFGQDNLQAIDSLLQDLHSRGRINGNVLIAERGKIIYNKSFGLSNERSKDSLNENSVFDLASVSKQFTAAGIVFLKERGKLKYEDSISKYIPELSFYKGVTIKHLLQHTGGLPDYMELLENSLEREEVVTNEDVILHFALNKPEISFLPGQDWSYSNTGYALLASIIERVSGLEYGEFLSKFLFKPLKMNHTFVPKCAYSSEGIDNLAHSYAYSDSLNALVATDDLEEFNYVKKFSGVVGDGGIYSTVLDLLKWDHALINNRLFSSEVKSEMFSPAVLADGSTFDYGYGWQLDSNDVFGKVIAHSGGWAGYLTLNEIHLESQIIIVALFNHYGSEIVHKSIRYGMYGLPEPNPTGKVEVALKEEQIQKVVGVYKIQDGMEFFISSKGGFVYASISNQAPLRLYPENEYSFFFKEFNATILFEENENRAIDKLTFFQNGRKMEGQKIR